MASNDELFRIILQVQGQEKAAELAKQVDAAEKMLKQFIQSQGNVATSSAAMGNALQVQAARVKGLKDQLEQVEKSNAKLAGGWKANTQGISQLGYAVDDLQYGHRGLLVG